MIGGRLFPALIGLLLVSLAVSACGGDDSPDPTATSAPEPTAIIDTPVTDGPLEIVGSTATDGVCQVTIPETWVDDGTGRGVTAQGDRWSVFGNVIVDDAAWDAARELLKSQMSGREGAEIGEDENSITVVLPNGRGYVVRERFENRYCELSVMANQDRPQEVTATWLGVAATLAPREQQ